MEFLCHLLLLQYYLCSVSLFTAFQGLLNIIWQSAFRQVQLIRIDEMKSELRGVACNPYQQCCPYMLWILMLRCLKALQAFEGASRCCTGGARSRRTLRARVDLALSLLLATDLTRGRGEVQGA